MKQISEFICITTGMISEYHISMVSLCCGAAHLHINDFIIGFYNEQSFWSIVLLYSFIAGEGGVRCVTPVI